jgi:fibronectin-binding autotransporter adhesin
MASTRIICTCGTLAIILIATPAATGQTENLQDHVWVGGTGNQQWQVDTNWNPPPFPNDPGRMDPSETTISPVEGANLSVNLPANLNVNVGATEVTVTALTIGGMSSAVTTNVTSSGGRLVFENFELNDDTDPDNPNCAFNCGAALITSQGVAGSTNIISAVVGLNDSLDIAGTRNITLSGGIQEMSAMSGEGGVSFRAVSPATTVFVTGNITTLDLPITIGDTMQDIPLGVNNGSVAQGTVDISGVISGAGRMSYGSGESDPQLPFGRVILRGNNTYSGRTIIGRGNLVLAHNNALGTGDVKQEGPAAGSLQTGYNLISDNDSRVITNDMIVGQWQTVKGENSLEWAGIVYQDNARGWINLLPAGKTLTLSGGHFPNHTEEMPPTTDGGRIFTFDGSGRTVITGGLHNEWSSETETINPGNYIGHYRFRGTGAVVISGGNSTYSANTIVQGANVHFSTGADMGNTAQVVSTAGAVGVDAGVAGILGKLDTADRGGLMLGTTEYGMNLDFNGALANAANMSLAAHEGGNAYTGTITPVANTYRLGGGSGTLTLPNVNQLTGTASVVATNGGEVRITGNNDYTGATRLVAKYSVSLQKAAEVDEIDFDDGDDFPNDPVYVGTTLTATTLANGGASSSIGRSSNAASNLYIQGSTLKYAGPTASTDRLFTIGTGGATIDSSGSGPITFSNAASLGIDIAEQRTGNVNAFATGNTANDRSTIRNLTSTEDLQPGMPISSPGLPLTGDGAGIPADSMITRIISATEVGINTDVGSFAFYNDTQIDFGAAPERTLTLTGTNTGNNALASLISNAADGGVVGVAKTGAGKWVLTGNNTYMGSTNVDAGTLLINGNQSGGGTTTVASGGTIGGTGTLGGGLVLENGASFTSQFDSGAIDPLAIMGDFNLSALGNTLSVAGTGAGTSWVIATYTGMLTGAFESVAPGYAVNYGSGMNSQVTLTLSGPVDVPGDYNQNGTVDAADYVVWRKNLGPGSLQNEGGISPGVVDVADYNFWRSRFGRTSGAGALHAGSAVPEPASLLLFGVALLSLMTRNVPGGSPRRINRGGPTVGYIKM